MNKGKVLVIGKRVAPMLALADDVRMNPKDIGYTIETAEKTAEPVCRLEAPGGSERGTCACAGPFDCPGERGDRVRDRFWR